MSSIQNTFYIYYIKERKKKGEEGKFFFVRAFLYALHLMFIYNIKHDLCNYDSYFSIYMLFLASIVIFFKIDESNFQPEKFG